MYLARKDLNSDGTCRARRALICVLIVVGSWFIILAGDWVMRFYWFRWHEGVYSRPVITADRPLPAVRGDFTTMRLPEGMGGDLTRLLGSPAARARYAIVRPAAEITLDPEGFRSPVYPATQRFDVVVVGDSYMTDGVPLTNMISERIAQRLGAPVLNRAFMGRGPFQSLMLWIEQNWHRPPHPKWIVWGFVERDVSGAAFAGYVYLIERHRGRVEVELTRAERLRPRVNWRALYPASLRASLPNSSALAQLSRRAWARIQYDVLRELPADVFELRDPASDAPPMLGYRIALESMYWPPAVRNLEQVVDSVAYIQEYLDLIGVKLLVVPIPDKEQVYRERIPRSVWKRGEPPPDSIAPDLVRRLQERGIAAVSLYEPFREAAARGIPVYWPDDTHWHPAGIGIAAELIAEALRDKL
jgi:hypothetical protein